MGAQVVSFYRSNGCLQEHILTYLLSYLCKEGKINTIGDLFVISMIRRIQRWWRLARYKRNGLLEISSWFAQTSYYLCNSTYCSLEQKLEVGGLLEERNRFDGGEEATDGLAGGEEGAFDTFDGSTGGGEDGAVFHHFGLGH